MLKLLTFDGVRRCSTVISGKEPVRAVCALAALDSAPMPGADGAHRGTTTTPASRALSTGPRAPGERVMNEATNAGATVAGNATDRVWRALEARGRYMMEGQGAAILAAEGVAAYLADAAIGRAAWCVEDAGFSLPVGLERAFCEAIVRADAAGWGGTTATGADWTATGAEVAAAYEAEGVYESFAAAVLMAYNRDFAVNRNPGNAGENLAYLAAKAANDANDLDNLGIAAAACRLMLAHSDAARGLPEGASDAAHEAALLAVCEQWIANDPEAARLLSKAEAA